MSEKLRRPVILMLDDDEAPHTAFDALVVRVATALGHDPEKMKEHVVHCRRSLDVVNAVTNSDMLVVAAFSDHELDSTMLKQDIFRKVKQGNPDALLVWASMKGYDQKALDAIHASAGSFLVGL